MGGGGGRKGSKLQLTSIQTIGISSISDTLTMTDFLLAMKCKYLTNILNT